MVTNMENLSLVLEKMERLFISTTTNHRKKMFLLCLAVFLCGMVGADAIIDDAYELTQTEINVQVGGTNKNYNPANFSGTSRVILKKHIVTVDNIEKNLLYQEDFKKGSEGARGDNENTVFVIRYDYELAEDITIPANCTLKFEGGNISGGHTLTGNNTGILAGITKIFGNDVTLAGRWNVAESYPEWFGAKGDGVIDDTFALQKSLDFSYRVIINKGTYRISLSSDRFYPHNNFNFCYGLKIINNDVIFKDATLFMDGWNDYHYFMILLLDAQNTKLSGKGTLIGDRTTHLTPQDPFGEGEVLGIILGNNIDILTSTD